MKLKTLSAKLLLMSSAFLLMIVASCFVLFARANSGQAQEVRQSWQRLSQGMEHSIGSQFFERYGDVQAFAKNSALHMRNVSEATKALNDYVNLYQVYDLILFVDLNGRVIASNTVDYTGKSINYLALLSQNYSEADWFLNASAEKFTEDSTKGLTGSYFEDAMVDPISSLAYDTARLGISFSTPVRDAQGKAMGVLTTRVSLRWIEYEFRYLYESLASEGLGNAELMLLNKKGETIIGLAPVAPDKPAEFTRDFQSVLLKENLISANYPPAVAGSQGKRGLITAKHPSRSIEQLVSFASLKDGKFVDSIGWTFLVRVEEKVLLGSILSSRNMFFGINALVLTLCLLGTAIFALRLSRRLARMSSSIARAGNEVEDESKQLATSSHELSSGAVQVASSLEETVSSLEELTSMVKVNSDNAVLAAGLSENSSKIAQEGEIEVKSLIGAIGDINQSSKKIEAITVVIDDIAFQTNLLALNAAVEAARAGDQGRGFAVVAEAVRSLAHRSAAATKEISNLIGENVSRIERGTRIADRSGQALQDILLSARKVAELNHEIASASQEQANGLSQISKAMNEIDQATQRNASAAETVTASSQQMNIQSEELGLLVNDLAILVHGHMAAIESEQLDRMPSNNGPKALGKSSKAFQGNTLKAQARKSPNDGHRSTVISLAQRNDRDLTKRADAPSNKGKTPVGF